jgi:spermidine synthase
MRFPDPTSQEDASLSRTRNWWWFIDRITDYEAHMHAISRTLVTERTEFQEVGIIESPVYGKILILDGDFQSAQLDEFIYHEALVQPSMTLHPAPEHVLILGGGEGATAREVLRHRCVKEVMMVDIDGKLVQICKSQMPEWSSGSFSDPRLSLVIDNAYDWLKSHQRTFDVILCDLTEPLPYTPSRGLYSVEFFQLIKSRLKETGIFTMQASRADIHDVRNHSALHRTITEIFPIVRSYLARIPSFDLVWSFAFSSTTIDPLTITPEAIDEILKVRLTSDLRFYDGETHRGIFSLPKYFRMMRAQNERVLQQGESLPMVEPAHLI